MIYTPKKEIERKFRLVRPTPSSLISESQEFKEIKQAYLPVPEGEVRLRDQTWFSEFSPKGGTRTFWLTGKSAGSLVRREEEIEIPEFIFCLMWQMNDRVVEKTRYVFRSYRPIAHRSFKVELDIYKGALAGLQTLECEFGSVRRSKAFVLPVWAHDAVEVTEDQRFKNKNLARHPEAVQEFLFPT